MIKKLLVSMLACGFALPVFSTPDSLGTDDNLLMRKPSYLRQLAASQLPPGNGNPEPENLFNKFLSGLNMGGYYRGYFWSRKMHTPYGNLGTEKIMRVGDVYLDPMLFLYVGGQPTPATTFGAEVMLMNPFLMYHGPGQTEPTVNPFFSTVLRGSANTKLGNFFLVAGGIEWTSLSPFTFGDNVGFHRYSLFERRPWDPVGNIKDRYAAYYYTGAISQDIRFGTRPFKGFMLTGTNMPFNTTLHLFYGQTPNTATAGILTVSQFRDYTLPSRNLGARISKDLKNGNRISLNTFNAFHRVDSINSNGKIDAQWNIYTSEFLFNLKDIIIAGEVGMGGYEDMNHKRGWSEGIITDIKIPKKYTLVPLSLRYFQIGKNFTSNVANFSNTSLREVTAGYSNSLGINTGTVQGIPPFGAALNSVGDLANNRRGGAINTEVKIWKIKLNTGIQISREMDQIARNGQISYGHAINALQWSRIPWAFPFDGGFGPNQRVRTFYRGAFETVTVTDTLANGAPAHKRNFNSMDFQLKYKHRFLGRDLYINYLGRFNSVQKHFSAVTEFSNKAYLRGYYQELELYYQLHERLILALYGGLENIKGNHETELGPYGRPRNQKGEGYGFGLDISLSAQTSVFFRQRWFNFKDKNFPGEEFRGQEGTIELKIFF
ncbi:MAG: hypothetical protein ACK40G_08065 [Cytophagaceae bacterium]